jgi:hypothetical protein
MSSQIAPSLLPMQPGQGGQAAPAGVPGKQQPGSAAPAGNGTAAGAPSPQALQDAIVAEKKKAEHWRGKAKEEASNNAALQERLARLEGLAQGMTVSGTSAKAPARTIADLDEAGIDAIVKKGFDEDNPGFVTESIREMARRAGEKAKQEAVAEARAEMTRTQAEQRVSARITSEFGQAAVLDEDSELRRLSDRNAARLLQADPDIFKKVPEALYQCFAAAQLELGAGDRGEFDRLRKQESERLARDEMERSTQVIATKAKDDVAELLAKGDKQSRREALIKRLPWVAGPRR